MMTEAHKLAKEAHGIALERHAHEAVEREKQKIATELLEEVYVNAAAAGGGCVGIQLSSELSALQREVALSLKGDQRVVDVTVDRDGNIRIWVDGSGFPKMPE